MQKQVPVFADLGGVITLDSDNNAGAGVMRDGSGNSAFNQVSAQEIKGTGFVTLKVATTLAAVATADTTAAFWPCDGTGGAFTVTLPAASSCPGRRYTFKRISSAGNVTIDGNGSETIDGATTYVLSAQWATVTIICTGSAWLIESKV